jgi:hypothetical protein
MKIRDKADITKEIGAFMIRALKDHQPDELFATCLTCCNFDVDSVFCRLYKQSPPPHIIVRACDQYMDIDDIPF